MFGFYRVASASPRLKVADIDFNIKKIIELTKTADSNNTSLIVFPELSVTGYTCGDLFFQDRLLTAAVEGLDNICRETVSIKILISVGCPVVYENSLYNCAVIIQSGNILGIVPKCNLPNYHEFYEKRWFTPYENSFDCEMIRINEKEVPFGTNLLFEYGDEFKSAFEICEDLWSVIPPSSMHTLAGATIIGNLSASNELVGKADYRRNLVAGQSGKCICSYIYTSSGIDESTSDVVYGGHSIISENGVILKENKRFSRESSLEYCDVDLKKIKSLRLSESSIKDNLKTLKLMAPKFNYRYIKLNFLNRISSIKRDFNPLPFVPSNEDEKNIRCKEIFSIQASGLAKRLEHTGVKKSVIGISGGLDSTLALLVTLEAHRLVGKSPQDIIAITMPGFGTTGRTYNNSLKMCEICNVETREVDIKEVCNLQFKLMNIDPDKKNTAYENVQARQRTKILMNTANNENGMVIGTGDLSEIALGWSTYNGDHMSMYSVNCSVPKTLIKYMISWCSDNSTKQLKEILVDIIDTPVSPELLPPDKQGNISQKTEDIIGPYELHDFFLYNCVKYGASPAKIKYLTKLAFKERYSDEYIQKILSIFIRRFFTQQFKRNCIPDGPKIGTIALSPRGDWRMPPDASFNEWIKNVNE